MITTSSARRIAFASAAGKQDWLVDLVFALALASVFSGMRYWVPGAGFVRPFDGLAMLCGLVSLTQYRLGALAFTPLHIPHYLYLFWYIVSAFPLGGFAMAREGIQIATVIVFVVSFTALCRRRPDNRVMAMTTVLLLLTAAYVVLWHVSQGYTAGFKRLGAAKTVFLLLPGILAGVLAWRRWPLPAVIGMTAFVLAITLLSGERKALICLGAFAVAATMLNPLRLGVAVVAAPLILLGAFAADDSGYLTHQFDSLASAPQYNDVFMYNDRTNLESYSDAERQFTKTVGIEYWRTSPLTGMGTSQYRDTVIRDNPGLGDHLTQGIHGEFLRVLVENGLIGLAFYGAAWIVNFVVLLRSLPQSGFLYGFQGAALARITIFAAALANAAYEALSNITYIGVLLAALLPLFLRDVPQPARAAAPRAPRPVRLRIAPPRPHELYGDGVRTPSLEQ